MKSDAGPISAGASTQLSAPTKSLAACLADHPTATAVSFEALQGREGLERLAPEWEGLAASLPGGPRFFHLPHWYRAFFDAQACNPHDIWFITARRGTELVAVLPLQYQNYKIFGHTPRLLGTIDDDQLQLCDFAFAQSEENQTLIDDFLHWLRGQSLLRWDALRLRKVPDDAAIAFSVRACTLQGCMVTTIDGSSWLDAANGYEVAVKTASKHFKQTFRRLTRRAEKAQPLRFECCSTPDELHVAFSHFLDIEASGWKGKAGVSGAIICEPALLQFYRAVIREFGSRGQCVIYLLWHGDAAVAAKFCLKIGRTLNILKVGYSEAHASFAPGVLLLDRVIRHCCEDPSVDTLHFVNDPTFARKLHPPRMDVRAYVVANTTLRGSALKFGLLVKRSLELTTQFYEKRISGARKRSTFTQHDGPDD